jgi:ferritin-like metal-binding protein YciE
MANKTLNDLFYATLKDVYFAEKQIYKSLPKLAKAAKSPQLKQAFLTHRQGTEGQIGRLEQVFELAGGVVGAPRLVPGANALLQVGNNLVGDAAVNVTDLAHRLVSFGLGLQLLLQPCPSARPG